MNVLSKTIHTDALTETNTMQESRRTMEICNACRYCEGYCPVFPAMTLHREFSSGDLGYLANLCHNCKGCWHACQYSPPHEFGINVPTAFANLRRETYAEHAWPRPLGRLFQRNGAFIALTTAITFALTIVLAMLLIDGAVMISAHRGEGAFYAVIPHNTMVWLGTISFGWAIIAMIMGVRSFWRASGAGSLCWKAVKAAILDAATTRHLGSHGEGCNDMDAGYSQGRRHMHLLTMWGFLLCFAATTLGTIMDYGLGWQAPYSWYSLPVVLGTVGGVMLMLGTAGLFWVKMKTDPAPEERNLWGMDTGLLMLLFLTAATGLALLFWRHTSAMGWLLAIHLGFVFSLFVTMPYGKFVHGIYRLAALIRYHSDR